MKKLILQIKIFLPLSFVDKNFDYYSKTKEQPKRVSQKDNCPILIVNCN